MYESIVAGTPIVGIPMLSDQRDMAVRVADAGVGLWVDKTRFTAAELSGAIDRVRQDPAFRSRLAPLQAARPGSIPVGDGRRRPCEARGASIHRVGPSAERRASPQWPPNT